MVYGSSPGKSSTDRPRPRKSYTGPDLDIAETISTTTAQVRDALDTLTFHESPPPSLVARSSQPRGHVPTYNPPDEDKEEHLDLTKDDPGRKRDGEEGLKAIPPVNSRDPEAALQSLITHLTHPDRGDTDPHLLAIGYELEALVAIYTSESVKLSISSRPPSIHSSDILDSNKAAKDSSYSSSSPTSTSLSYSGSYRSGIPNGGNTLDIRQARAAGLLPSTFTLESPGGSTSSSSSGSTASTLKITVVDVPNHPRASNGPRATISEIVDGPSSGQGSNGGDTGPSRFGTWQDAVEEESLGLSPIQRIRYEVLVPLWDEGEVLDGVEMDVMPEYPVKMRVLVSLPPTYPFSSPPQLQLLGRYLGSFPIDAGLFGQITRTYIASTGVPFTPGDVCVFEGLQHAQSLCREWYTARLVELAESDKARNADKQQTDESIDLIAEQNESTETRPTPNRARFSYSSSRPNGSEAAEDLSTGLVIHASEPIIDRKSTFLGHAIQVDDEKLVPLVIHELLCDKKIARAAHPAIFAYRIAVEKGGVAGKVINTDYDDDGETAAGARLMHLLEILELENVLVVVTRWFGGTLLGADRFKHINQAARDALAVGGFLNDHNEKSTQSQRKGKKR